MITLAGLLAGALLAAVPAVAAPLSSTPLVQENIQGATSGADSKWSTTVSGYARMAEIVALQEVGPQPPGVRQATIVQPQLPQVGRRGYVQHHLWTPWREAYDVYFLQTDANGGTFEGGRNNIALVTQRPADEVYAVPNPNGRPALGVRFGNDWYFTFHAQSMGGRPNDSADMLQRVANWVNGRGRGEQWTVMADFNLEPGTFATPPGTQTYRTHLPTHQSGGELDFAVSSTRIPGHPVNRLNGAAPDHYAVAIGAMRAGAEPPPLNLDLDVKLMPVGDSITDGQNSSANNGYREPLWHELLLDDSLLWKRDIVGSQRSGDMHDPDHEGYRGKRIDEVARKVECAVPAYRPNIVTLHIGTNDINQNYHLGAAPERLGDLIDQILVDAPEATVLVATLVPSTKEGLQERIDRYNAALPQVVAERRAQGKAVRLVDMSAVTTADVDGSHPNDEGYRKMARSFRAGIARAAADGWLKPPVPGTAASCADGAETVSRAGAGWRSLGVIAPGMSSPDGRTDIVELNGDDRGDYVRITSDGAVRAALNTPGEPGRPDWVDIDSDITAGVAGGGERTHFADLNGDGRDDLLREGPVDGQLYFYENRGVEDGRMRWYVLPVKLPVTGVPREAIRYADVNGDGRDDFLRTSDAGAVHAYLNLPSGDMYQVRWVEWLNWAPGVSYGSRDKLRLADVNGDRRADYLMVGAKGAVHAYMNNGGRGAGGFEEHLNFVHETGYPGSKSTFRDISGDGRADYLVIYDGGAIRCWLNIGGNM
ncbi:GDSL-type esterase/lipase family protein [Streptomyces sp. NPDC005931]|uniref:GDSL-type esterase/lipase family protein n=1 Tax=Streptomyces sp. NPDC005931 TaxID=3364737 RepID=UPI0036740D59